MSDWSTAWSGAREGIIAGTQLAEQRRARKVQEGFEGTRVDLERQRTEDEKRRTQSDLDTAAQERRVRARVFDPLPPAAPGFTRTAASYNPQTGWQATDTVLPSKDNLNFIDIPDSSSAIATAPGMTPTVVPKMLPFVKDLMGGNAPSAAPSSSASPGWKGAPYPLPQVSPPGGVKAPAGTPPSPGPAGSPDAPAPAEGNFNVKREMFLNGLDANGHPKIGVRHVWEDNSHPHIRTVQVPGMPFPTPMQGALDPETGRIDWHPLPESQLQGKLTDRQQAVSGALSALRIADELESTVNRSGNWETALFGNSRDAAALDQLPIKLSIAMARAMNPGNAPTEAQIEADKKYLVPLGWATPNSKTLGALANLKEDLGARMREMGIEGDVQKHFADRGMAFPDEKSVEAAVQAGKVRDGDQVMVGGHIAVWHDKSRK